MNSGNFSFYKGFASCPVAVFGMIITIGQAIVYVMTGMYGDPAIKASLLKDYMLRISRLLKDFS